jgi:tRNA (mo5U34)-methyltransferase
MPERTGQHASALIKCWGGDLAQSGWWHSFELPDGRKIRGANDLEGLKRRIALFPIPEDLSGKRVLDIGAWDGWFSFEMERRGADVVAVDNTESDNFLWLHRELKSKIDYRILDVYELTPETVGRFDIVLFLGVLYHLKHPLLALERICNLTKEFAAVGSFTSPDKGPPMMEFYELDELGGQFDNWVGPNPSALVAMCRAAGFARADLLNVNEFGSSVACYRHFAAPARMDAPAPGLINCIHITRFGIDFSSLRDDYASCWFQSDAEGLNLDSVQIRVGSLDARPVYVARDGELWQANFKVPLGLDPGWHEVRVRTESSEWSGPLRIALDVPVVVEGLIEITGACDGTTWSKTEITSPVLSVWVSGAPQNGGRDNIRVTIGERRCRVDYVSQWRAGTSTQLNVAIPKDLGRGEFPVTVEIAQAVSQPVSVNVR